MAYQFVFKSLLLQRWYKHYKIAYFLDVLHLLKYVFISITDESIFGYLNFIRL